MAAKEWTDNKMFKLRNDLIGLDQEEITSQGPKHFRETNDRLCKVSTALTKCKQNDRLCEILFIGCNY